MVHAGGRPRKLTTEDIIRAGRQIGLAQLSLNAVASRLSVTPAALYRHVANRWELERMVGEDILAELILTDDPQQDTAQHLLSVGLQLRAFILDHPGLAAYVQTLFPRGASGRRLLSMEATALGKRGYSVEAALVLSSAVASVAIGYAATEELQRTRGEGYATQRNAALQDINTDTELAEAHQQLPDITPDEYVRMWLGAAVAGFIAAAPPGRSVSEIRNALHAATEGVNHG
ncbi:TetR/AcrR family transcriptional regulator [Glutamicibacter sp. NPDC087344]|uniref:TetR/AcrR family transcriptional regulator n=1 Tax=Glutamicibacter sp. NPDC087344 TaxID=3363994 RepID=UPI00380A58C4